ncbi:hypothetical protein G7047_12955 [Diaphorobacter sp. HDW4A]|nr:hypothetical protein G7047_12955 [Diaphorobacter sp. HDW4A]
MQQAAATAAPTTAAPAPKKSPPVAAEPAVKTVSATTKKAPKSAKPAEAKTASKAASKARKVVAKDVQKEAKEVKPKKPKLVRDSFTIPKDEYAVIDTLKLRSAKFDHQVKKSELLRAGLKLLASLNDQQLQAALRAVPAIKTGRPKAEDSKTSKK